MITRPTVFILGAGASIPYGFPSGRQLRNNVIKRLQSANYGGWHDILRDLGFIPSEINNFVVALRGSGLISIDAFLERRTEFMEIGKATIALGLIQYEEQNRLNNPDNDERSWYEYFYNKLITQSLEYFIMNRVSIITFNYDRSFEQYLFTTLKFTFGKTDKECAELLKNFSIIHVHGQLGNLPWQAQNSRHYSQTETVEEVKKAVEGIVVVSEVNVDSFEFSRAFELLAEAERIYFLGFSYLNQNLSRLKINNIRAQNKASFYGTTFGMGLSDKNAMLKKWDMMPGNFKNVEIHDFLKNHARWD